MKHKRILSAAAAAALSAASITAYTAAVPFAVFAEGVTLEAPQYLSDGLEFVEKSAGVYAAAITESQLESIAFSPKDASVGRGFDGYWQGFYIEAVDKDTHSDSNATYKSINTYVADLEDATITGLFSERPDGTSTDGQFWAGFRYDWIKGAPAERPYLVYAVEVTLGEAKQYVYTALDCSAISSDFAFANACTDGDHETETACGVCGNKKAALYSVEIESSIADGEVTADKTEAEAGDTVTVTAKPDEGYELDEITVTDAEGNPVDVGADNTFTMPENDVTVSASFKKKAVEEKSYDIAVTKPENGSVTADAETAKAGVVVTVTAKPDEGYELDEITVTDAEGNPVDVGADNTFTMPGNDVTVSASFKKKAVEEKSYAITVTKPENGSVTADAETAKAGVVVTVTAKPDEGYELDEITVTDADGKAVAVADGKFTMPGNDVTVSASFKEAKKPVTSEPDTSEPGTSEPGTSEPGTSEPGTSEPDTSKPGTSEPTSTPSVDNKPTVIENKETGTSVEIPAGEKALEGAEFRAVELDGKAADEEANVLIDNLSSALSQKKRAAAKKAIEAAVKAVKDGDGFAFDFSFVKGGKEVQPNGLVKVTISVPDEFKSVIKSLNVYHLTDEGALFVESEIEGENLIFYTDSFSPYVITTENIENAPKETSSSSSARKNTADASSASSDNSAPAASDGAANPATGIALAVTPIVIAASVTAVVSIRKNKK